MKRKDIVLVLSKYFGRYPTVPEINYFDRTGLVKKVQHFTKEEQLLYNPSRHELNKVFDFIKDLLYIWHNKDKIKAKLEREEKRRVIKERIARRDVELNKRWEAVQIKRLREQKYLYFSKSRLSLLERAIKRQTAIDNKRRIRDILHYHTETGVAIPEEMWEVIIKYK